MRSPPTGHHAAQGPGPGALLHGTTALNAARIAVEGFGVLASSDPGALGRGIYLTRSLAWACEYMRDFEGAGRGVVLQVELAPGTRLLRLDGQYDPRAIDSLRREFGAQLLQVGFHEALPRNKHLKPRELIELLNFLVAGSDQITFGRRPGWSGESGIRHVLRRSGYMGYGCDRSDSGLVIFDPARVGVTHWWRLEGPVELVDEGPGKLRFRKRPRLVPATPLWLLDAAEALLCEGASNLEEWERLGERHDELYDEREVTSDRRHLARSRELLDEFRRRFAEHESL